MDIWDAKYAEEMGEFFTPHWVTKKLQVELLSFKLNLLNAWWQQKVNAEWILLLMLEYLRCTYSVSLLEIKFR